MRENLRSLRIYFWVVGILGLGPALTFYGSPNSNVRLGLIGWIGLALAVCYMWVGATLPNRIVTAPDSILGVLVAASAVLGLRLGLSLWAHHPEGVAIPVVGLLINWYLIVNVRRLAHEHGLPTTG